MSGLDIAFVLGSPDISGGTNVIYEHAFGLQARGHRVTIVTTQLSDRAVLAWHERARGLTFVDHAGCRDRTFDVAVATWWRTVYDLPWVPARRWAYFVQSIESRFAQPTDAESRALAEFTYRLPAPVVTEARWVAEYLRAHYGREATVVRNGIRKHLFTPDGPTVDAGRPHGLRVLVEGPVEVPFKRVPLAVRLCREAGIDDVWLLTASAIDSWPGVRRVCSRLPIEEVAAVYRSCDVLVKISTVEGMFGPPLEMMHCGGTCITSDVTGWDEYVRDGENALVVPRGEEHGVIEALRRLAADPALLARLRAGALATARAWPTWEETVGGMEAFLADVVRRPDDPARLRRDVMDVLRAALELAGPLRVAQHADRDAWALDYPAWTLLRIAKRAARKALTRAVGARADAPPAPSGAVAPLPPPVRPAAAAGGRLRVAFVGDPARHLAHAPASGTDFASVFLHAPADEALLRSFAPDWTVVFVPEALTPAGRNAIPGPVVGVLAQRVRPEALRAVFGLEAQRPERVSCLVHPEVDVVTALRAAGLNAVAAFLPPVDTAAFACPPERAAWDARRIDVLLHGPPPAGPAGRGRAERLGAVAPAPPAAETLLAPLLWDTRISVHPPEAAADPLLVAKIVRDLVAGCLVVAPHVPSDRGLFAGEHYLGYENERDLERAVGLARTTPERAAMVRRVGWSRAQELGAPARWAGLFADLVGARTSRAAAG